MIRSFGFPSVAGAVLFMCVGLASAYADDGSIYAIGTITYDSNLFRFSENPPAGAAGPESDTYYSIGIGYDRPLTFSQQRLTLHAQLNENRFRRFSYLNYQGGDASAVWDWHAGRALNGRASYEYNRSLPAFADAQDSQRDIRTTRRAVFNAEFKPLPRWRLRPGVARQEVSHSATNRGSLNNETDTQELALRYVSRRENYVGLFARTLETHYAVPEQLAVGAIDSDFEDKQWGAELDWRYSGLSHFQFSVAHTQRRHVALGARDYRGATGRVTYNYVPTGKLSIATALSRDLGGADDVVASYVVSDTVSIAPQWHLTAKTRVRGSAIFQARDYRGDPNALLGVLEERADRARTFGIDWLYAPLPGIETSVGYRQGTRISTREFADYRYRSLTATLIVAF